jgi:hypothetical protein
MQTPFQLSIIMREVTIIPQGSCSHRFYVGDDPCPNLGTHATECKHFLAGPLDRGVIAQMLQNMLKKVAEEGSPPPPDGMVQKLRNMLKKVVEEGSLPPPDGDD